MVVRPKEHIILGKILRDLRPDQAYPRPSDLRGLRWEARLTGRYCRPVTRIR